MIPKRSSHSGHASGLCSCWKHIAGVVGTCSCTAFLPILARNLKLRTKSHVITYRICYRITVCRCWWLLNPGGDFKGEDHVLVAEYRCQERGSVSRMRWTGLWSVSREISCDGFRMIEMFHCLVTNIHADGGMEACLWLVGEIKVWETWGWSSKDISSDLWDGWQASWRLVAYPSAVRSDIFAVTSSSSLNPAFWLVNGDIPPNWECKLSEVNNKLTRGLDAYSLFMELLWSLAEVPGTPFALVIAVLSWREYQKGKCSGLI